MLRTDACVFAKLTSLANGDSGIPSHFSHLQPNAGWSCQDPNLSQVLLSSEYGQPLKCMLSYTAGKTTSEWQMWSKRAREHQIKDRLLPQRRQWKKERERNVLTKWSATIVSYRSEKHAEHQSWRAIKAQVCPLVLFATSADGNFPILWCHQVDKTALCSFDLVLQWYFIKSS